MPLSCGHHRKTGLRPDERTLSIKSSASTAQPTTVARVDE